MNLVYATSLVWTSSSSIEEEVDVEGDEEEDGQGKEADGAHEALEAGDLNVVHLLLLLGENVQLLTLVQLSGHLDERPAPLQLPLPTLLHLGLVEQLVLFQTFG